jgi:hypothetical protein
MIPIFTELWASIRTASEIEKIGAVDIGSSNEQKTLIRIPPG